MNFSRHDFPVIVSFVLENENKIETFIQNQRILQVLVFVNVMIFF